MYQKTLHIHFIGIGGIGMSGIATILAKQGYTISGCDTDIHQKTVTTLQTYGCSIHAGNNNILCSDSSIDIVVYSSAITPDHPELKAAQKRNIPIIPRALMLAELMRTKYSIAVAGAHGKTTTTALIAHILIQAQRDPTVIIGGHLKAISHNAHYGAGEFLVAEADESDRSLVHLHATLALVTNIDLEHLETYRDLDDIKQTFLTFLTNIPFYGAAFLCIDDHNIQSLLPLPQLRIITYGFNADAFIRGTDLVCAQDETTMTIIKKGCDSALGSVRFTMPGKHNATNALGALALCLELGVPFSVIADALASFSGVERRFSYHGTYKGAALFDDYGHHPNEIKHTLQVARMKALKKLIVVFQPHRFIRTERLWDQFLEVFLQSSVDQLIVTDIYGAGEKPIERISSPFFVEDLKAQKPLFSVCYAPYESDHASIKHMIDSNCSSQDLILLLGAGKINKVAETLLS